MKPLYPCGIQLQNEAHWYLWIKHESWNNDTVIHSLCPESESMISRANQSAGSSLIDNALVRAYQWLMEELRGPEPLVSAFIILPKLSEFLKIVRKPRETEDRKGT